MTEHSQESEAEAKKIKETFQAAVEGEDSFDALLVKHPYWKTIRVMAWIARFIHNSKVPKRLRKNQAVLTTSETEQEVKRLIRREQKRYSNTERFREDQLRLNHQKNSEGIYEYRGRVQGNHPVYLPKSPCQRKLCKMLIN